MWYLRAGFLVLLPLIAAAAHAAEPATKPLMWKSIYGTVLHDAKREKELRVTLHIPDAPGPHPLIIFSHGAGGSGDNYNLLVTGWTRKDYVVIAPTHADSISLMTPDERRGLRPRDVVIDAVTDTNGWENRARDVTFILDSLEELEQVVPRLAGKIDRARIGVGGHSYGALTAQVVAGATIRTRVGGPSKSFADPRVKAALLLSGQGEGQMGLSEGSWDAIKLPLMVMTGSEDRGAKGQDPQWRKAPFSNSPEGNKHWVFIDGATHSSFLGRLSEVGAGGGLRRADDDRPRRNHKAIFDVVQRATLAFWDAYLKDDPNAQKLLASDGLATDPDVKVEYETR